MLYDNHGRKINYLRLAVTDRCNLRCFYCMPENGIDFVQRKDLLSYEEMHQVVSQLASLGISKVRITGGEPFVRKGLMEFLHELNSIPDLNEIHLTTNGTLTAPHIPDLKKLGIAGINLSMDSLDRWRFESITRKDKLPEVMDTLHQLIESEIPTKINMVVMEGRNTEDIVPMAELSRDAAIEVRYIEEMPFNGSERTPGLHWNFAKVIDHLKTHFGELEPISSPKTSTAKRFRIKGYKGVIGVIPAFTRTFCGTCNRVRLTPIGELRTCLYGPPQLQIRDIIRKENFTPDILESEFKRILANRAINGFEAEKQNQHYSRSGIHESMTSIGG